MSVTIDGTTGISGVAGSASAPALVGSDADSGYYINSANQPSASVNGTAVWNAASSFGFKNRIINGGMTIAQRGTSTTTKTGVLVDMWRCNIDSPSSLTISQSSTAPTGFNNSLLVTVTTGGAIGSYLNYVSQAIEGYNCADFGFGTANAKTVTISFWVRSSITGTFGGSLRNYAPAVNYRGYPFTYTINAANTWEQKTVTIAGDGVTGAGDWNTTNNGSLTVFFDLGTQSGYTAAANSWISQNVVGATGTQTSLVATNGATWYVTGVQLEVGSTATSFDFRSYGTELSLCQRYYIQITQGSNTALATMANWVATSAYGAISLPATMRATPTGSYSSLSHFTYYTNSLFFTPTTLSIGSSQGATTTTSEILISTGSAFTAGQSGWLRITSGNGYIAFSAEL